MYPYLVIVAENGTPIYAEPYPTKASALARMGELNDTHPNWDSATATATLMDFCFDGDGDPLYSPDDSEGVN